MHAPEKSPKIYLITNCSAVGDISYWQGFSSAATKHKSRNVYFGAFVWQRRIASGKYFILY